MSEQPKNLPADFPRKIENKIEDGYYWLVPSMFALLLILLVSGIAIAFIRTFKGMESTWVFSIGADIFTLAICMMLIFSCMLNRFYGKDSNHFFAAVLTVNGVALFLDEMCWVVQGNAQLRQLNLVINVLFFISGAILVYFFWRYVSNAMDMNRKILRIMNNLFTALLVPTILLCLVNLFYPLYFSVDENGFYHRGDHWLLSQLYLLIGITIFIAGITVSKAPRRDKLVVSSFVAIPLINQFLTIDTFGLSTQYAATLVSIVLIYGVVFADREKRIVAKENELAVGTKIQASMMPSEFPAFPDRKDFDIYASMHPAREVGGDFYDFFLIDDDHLALVIADVSDKGVPAALFMMASKILLRNHAMSGMSPKDILEKTNNQICLNNREEMFVTVWLGIADLKEGKITAANAGHEYPVIKEPDGKFALLKDKHGFVLGGMAGVKYKEYEIPLKKGTKLFLYTDGISEATSENKELFGNDRMVDALNHNENANVQEVLGEMDNAVAAFVENEPQFDDQTMLCFEYLGEGETV